jgi:hydroxymethylglutaryl-CoA reductase
MTVHVRVPRAMGLGSSAALAVATVRALSGYFDLKLTDEAVIAQAFEAEKMAHGTPSGVDNALAGLGRPLLFRRGAPAPKITAQRVGAPLPWVVGLSHAESLTSTTVAAVRARHDACPSLYDRLFGQIDALTLEASAAMARGDLEHLGRLMNINHGLLHALDVSTGQIEQLIFEARRLGAWGAKVTGGGGGGSMLALCADAAMQQRVAQGFEHLGYAALMTTTEVTDA